MALLDIMPAPAIRTLVALRRVFAGPVVPASPEDDRARRANFQDIISACPEAFGSEADVHAMMHLYPGRY